MRPSITFFAALAVALHPVLSIAAFGADESSPRSVLIEPLDVSDREPPSLEVLNGQIKDLVDQASHLNEVANEWDDQFDGSPEEAMRISLGKLLALQQITRAATKSAATSEAYRWTVLELKADNCKECLTLCEQKKAIDAEIEEIASQLRIDGSTVIGKPELQVLLAKKLERANDMRWDYAAVNASQRNVTLILEGLDKLDRSLETHRQILREEVLRQSAAIQRSRLSEQSATLAHQAEALYGTVSRLQPAVQAISSRASSRTVQPDAIAPSLPETVGQEVTQEMQSVIHRFMTTRK